MITTRAESQDDPQIVPWGSVPSGVSADAGSDCSALPPRPAALRSQRMAAND
jgi:hypothetical protein